MLANGIEANSPLSLASPSEQGWLASSFALAFIYSLHFQPAAVVPRVGCCVCVSSQTFEDLRNREQNLEPTPLPAAHSSRLALLFLVCFQGGDVERERDHAGHCQYDANGIRMGLRSAAKKTWKRIRGGGGGAERRYGLLLALWAAPVLYNWAGLHTRLDFMLLCVRCISQDLLGLYCYCF